jgi:DNA-binding NarL/FixJ family response regulator
MDKLINILIVDDHSMIREGVIKMVSTLPYVRHYDEVENGQMAIKKLTEQPFDIVILDIYMKEMDGIEVARYIKKNHQDIKIIMFSMYNEKRQVIELIEIGVEGYILKSADRNEIINAIKMLTINGKYFTPEVIQVWNVYNGNRLLNNPTEMSQTMFSVREIEIIKLSYEGLTVKQMADKISLSENTVSSHRHNMMKKAGVNNLAGLIKYAISKNIIIP